MKILVIDDSKTVCRFMGLCLGAMGHQVMTRNTPLGTTVEAVKFKPDLILLDVEMPGLDGMGLSEILHSELLKTPILFVTGNFAKGEYFRRTRKAPVLGVIQKRSGCEELVEEIRKFGIAI